MWISKSILFGSCLALCCSLTFAAEVEELREKSRALKREAAAIRDENPEAAERLVLESRKLMDEAKQIEAEKAREHDREKFAEPKQSIEKIKARIAGLMNRERQIDSDEARSKIRKQIAELTRRLQELRPQAEAFGAEMKERAEKFVVMRKRIEHLHAAAEQLLMADVTDLARQIQEKAELMERELEVAKARMAEEIEKLERRRARNSQNPEVNELHDEIARLRAEVDELRQQLKSRQ